jgi:hypothetical protein
MIKESANWTYNDAPIVTSERLTRARLSWCSNALLRLGCTIPGGCRLSLAETVLAAIDADKSAIENADGRAKVAEVQRMAWEFTVILVAAVNTRLDANPFTVAKLEQMLGGPLVPTGGEDHSRDT